MRDDFAVFILTHGRPNHIPTVAVLERGNYTGRLYLLIDNEDDCEEEYRQNYGEKVVVFDKEKYFQTADTMDTTGKREAILFARLAVFDVAKELGVKSFLMLEDDFVYIGIRYVENNMFRAYLKMNLDDLFESMVEFLYESGALTVCFAQGGDFIGGPNENFAKRLSRKAMNSFFCRTDRPIDFRGTMCEDVVAYTTLGSRGQLMFTTMECMVCQKQSQGLDGGMTETYKETGTYQKTFYPVMSMPSAVKVSSIRDKWERVHHVVAWRYCVPLVLNERWKKCKQSAH